MQTSRFQLGLIATLAVGLGFSLSSSDAVGYPAGAAVGLGSNPVSSKGGSVHNGGSAALFTADASGPFLVTDVVITAPPCDYHSQDFTVSINQSDGTTLAEFRLVADRGYASDAGTHQATISHAYSSGIAIPAGSSATIHNSGCGNIGYSVSGYQAQG